jgi:hypothetical protein
MGVRTAIVAVGLRRGIGLALLLTAIGALGLLSSFSVLFAWHPVSWMVFGLLPLTVACVFVVSALLSLYRSMRGDPVEQAVLVKRGARWR